MVVIGLSRSTVYVPWRRGLAGEKGLFVFLHRHGTAVWRASLFFAPSKVNAAGPSAERGKERLMIGWVALNPFAFLTPSFARSGWGGPWGWLSDPVFRCYRGRCKGERHS